MDRINFIKFLENSGLSNKASIARANWANRIENSYAVDLDNMVISKSNILDLVERIYADSSFTERQRRNFPNAVRKYYLFRRGESLGTLRENGRK